MRIGVTCVMRSTADNITTWQNIITAQKLVTLLPGHWPHYSIITDTGDTRNRLIEAIHGRFVCLVASRSSPDLVKTMIFQARRWDLSCVDMGVSWDLSCVAVLTCEWFRHRGKNSNWLKTNKDAPSLGPRRADLRPRLVTCDVGASCPLTLTIYCRMSDDKRCCA